MSENNAQSMIDNKKREYLINKYSAYKEDSLAIIRPEFTEAYKCNETQLLDAVLSGCMLPCIKRTLKEFSSEVERDIDDILRLMPNSLNCVKGSFRCRDYVGPLQAACNNKACPLYIVELLLQHGADTNALFDLNGQLVNILPDLKLNLEKARYEAIRKLFYKYGYKNDIKESSQKILKISKFFMNDKDYKTIEEILARYNN